ncbi:MAG: type II toxin-antitoxin system HicB family antitoxin [Bacteroidota bacterium]|nr:type II toxin-antitoxin system HicB family antitoxin [Bacteroidota bacterium]
MKKIKIIIERSKDHYNAYAENVKGVYGAGDTVAEAKQSILDSIKLLKKYNEDKNIPKILKGDYELVFKFDTESLLNYYNGIFSKAALERITGINQKQIQHYSTGLKRPRPTQVKRIETALHKLGAELLAVEL